ncbi:MAG: FAD-dependent oxidoreductase [Opitutaceae bacterium]
MNPASTPFVSVFEHTFDTVVFGAGCVGYAAARRLAAQGIDTLLVEPSGDLLWEATRALENTAASSSGIDAWEQWLFQLRAREGADGQFFDPALAEILTAHELSTGGPSLRTLLYATPVALETAAAGISTVIVGTKSGPRRIHARRWLDATESGLVVRLAQPALKRRTAVTSYRSLVLHSPRPEALDLVFPALAERHPGLAWFTSVRTGERRLRWPAGNTGPAWHHKVPSLIADLRALLATTDDTTEVHFVVSHCAMTDFPVYTASAAIMSAASVPVNLTVASPAFRSEALATPADRFMLGITAATELPSLPPASVFGNPSVASLLAPSASLEAVDVLVAGVGTGGAFAALAAARGGARTLAIEFTPYPGGVGTGAGICGYFHGAKGGLQSEIDERTREITTLLTGVPAHLNGWHHEAKKIVLLTLFEDAGVTFLGDVLLTGVERDAAGRVLAAQAVIDGRLTRIPATAFIDATGDGDLAALAGANFITGRPGDGRTLSYSQSIFALTPKERSNDLHACNFDAGWVDPTDPEDLSRARLTGIAQHLQPIWTQPNRAVAVAPLLGLRQSRQIDTDIKVTMADLVGHARFADSIGETETVADTHSVDYEFESDEMAFYYWTCRGFRHSLRSELPYRMMLPRGLANVWVACRAAGIETDAAYGLRMQRDMQRLGEAAGLAAALAASKRTDARGIDFSLLQGALDRSGARRADRSEDPTPSGESLLASLDKGLPGVHLWHLSRNSVHHRAAVESRLQSREPRVSFYAAAILAMWNDPAAEPRLIAALVNREEGPTPEEKPVVGAFAQCIDLPFWLQAVVFLRRIGTARCLPGLNTLAATPSLPLNVRTLIALTLERLAICLERNAELVTALDALLADRIPDSMLPPSRSLWRTLHGEPQKKLGNDRGAPVAQDHSWQLHLIIARTRKQLGLAPRPESAAFTRDLRSYVRQAFAQAF